jgi:hypothetical protein
MQWIPSPSRHSQVVGAEERAERATTDRVHGSGLEVDEDGAGHIFASGGLVVVDVDALELDVAGALVGAVGLDAVLLRDDLPGSGCGGSGRDQSREEENGGG